MNTLGITLLWIALQVSAFCAMGSLLYLMARRRDPVSGAWTAGATLVVAIGLSALALSPWPRWWTVAGGDATSELMTGRNRPAAEPSTGLSGLDAPAQRETLSDASGAPSPVDSRRAERSDWRAFWSNLQRGARQSSDSDGASTVWRWPAWLAVAILAACGLGAARLLVAFVAIGGCRRLTREVTNREIVDLLNEIRASMGCARPIELRETAAICSPSTVGWLRPIVILPGDWRGWTVQDCRAVLAHEVAHVARGDFAACLAAQLGVAIHFYNPLVHWLAGRLRLEQEMAADLYGASVAGGRQLYLTTLAQMALRQNGPALSWAARPFLPTRGALMRRIEMLHRQTMLPNLSLSYTRRALVAAALVVAGSLLAGVRGPGNSPAASAAPPAQQRGPFILTGQQTIGTAPFNPDYVSPDAQVVVAMRPSVLVTLKALESFTKTIEQLGGFEPLGVPLADIEEFKFVLSAKSIEWPKSPEDAPWGLMVLRSSKPQDWSKLISSIVGPAEKATADGQEYFKKTIAGPALFTAYWHPDDRTIVLTSAERIGRTFALRGENHRPAWAEKWKLVAGGPAAVMIGPAALQVVVNRMPHAKKPAADVSELLEIALFNGAQVGGAFQVAGNFACRSPEAARQVAALVQQAFDAMKHEFAEANKAGPAAALEASGLPKIMLQLVDATKIEVNASTVHTQTTVSPEIGNELTKAVGPARKAAHRNHAANKMKQIAIALLNYHEVYKHFPPAVVIGPDGKTPHSWRVEMLPLLEKKDLYDRYKMDEPWDSENNKKLIAEGADFFSVPGDKPDSDCGFFVLTGPGTVFDPGQPPCKIRNIVDGSSKTIGLVEANRSIPWTKPEDIEYAPDKPLPKFGGFFDGGFHMSLVDGSVRFYPSDFNEKTLRAMISRGGREVINFDNTTNLPALAQ